MKKIKKKFMKDAGFTLVETSIVLLIIATLTLLIIPNATGVKNSVDGSTSHAVVSSVEAQILLYETNNPGKKYDAEGSNFIGEYVTQSQYDAYVKASKD